MAKRNEKRARLNARADRLWDKLQDADAAGQPAIVEACWVALRQIEEAIAAL